MGRGLSEGLQVESIPDRQELPDAETVEDLDGEDIDEVRGGWGVKDRGAHIFQGML